MTCDTTVESFRIQLLSQLPDSPGVRIHDGQLQEWRTARHGDHTWVGCIAVPEGVAFGIAEPKFGNPAYGDGVIESLLA